MAAETYKALCVSSLFNITCFYFYWIYFLLFMSIFSRVSLYFFWQLQLLEQETLWRHRRFVILRYFQKVAQHDWLLGWFFFVGWSVGWSVGFDFTVCFKTCYFIVTKRSWVAVVVVASSAARAKLVYELKWFIYL